MARNLKAEIARLERQVQADIEDKRKFLNTACAGALIVHISQGAEIRALLGPVIYDYFLNVYQKNTRTTSLEEWLKIEDHFIETDIRCELFKQMLDHSSGILKPARSRSNRK